MPRPSQKSSPATGPGSSRWRSAFLRNHADAEEVVQDTFLRAHRGLCRFRGDSSLATWLHRITINLSHNRHAYFFRRRRHDTFSLDCPLSDRAGSTFGDLVAATEPNPARELANREFAELVTVCMARLSPSQREILARRDLLNHTYGDIARDLGLNMGTVKSRIARRARKPEGAPWEVLPRGNRGRPVDGMVRVVPPGRAPGRHHGLTGSEDRHLDAALDDPVGDGVAGEARRIVDRELVHQVLPVLLDRLDADVERRGDLLVRLSLGHQLDDLLLAHREAVRLQGDPPPGCPCFR